jgi:hypothetical protein
MLLLCLEFISFCLRQIFVTMISWSTTFIIVFVVLSSSIIADDPCRFVDPSKGVIDLTSLARHDGKAAYPDVIPKEGGYYRTLILVLPCYLLFIIE